MSVELEGPGLIRGGLAEDCNPVVFRPKARSASSVSQEPVVGKRDITSLAITLGTEDRSEEVTGALQLFFVEVTETHPSLGAPGWDIGPLGFLGAVGGKGGLSPELLVERREKGTRPVGHLLRGMCFQLAGSIIGKDLAGQGGIVAHRFGRSGGKSEAEGESGAGQIFHEGAILFRSG